MSSGRSLYGGGGPSRELTAQPTYPSFDGLPDENLHREFLVLMGMTVAKSPIDLADGLYIRARKQVERRGRLDRDEPFRHEKSGRLWRLYQKNLGL